MTGCLPPSEASTSTKGQALEDMVSLRLWMTDKLVVTVRKDRVFAMEDLAKQMLTTDVPPTPARLVARVTENLVARIEQVSLDLELRTDQLEEAIYDNDSGGRHNPCPLAPQRDQTAAAHRADVGCTQIFGNDRNRP